MKEQIKRKLMQSIADCLGKYGYNTRVTQENGSVHYSDGDDSGYVHVLPRRKPSKPRPLYKLWTGAEDNMLLNEYVPYEDNKALCEKLGRSKMAIDARRYKLLVTDLRKD